MIDGADRTYEIGLVGRYLLKLRRKAGEKRGAW